ncbi:MAG TPA: DUF4190 domain-containing protein [Micromonosporaceae bacterium]|nr:DUF4190 domain-containing protein [Micromonosporaceae bacterium]
MSYPTQQPGGWSDPSWPGQPQQPYDPKAPQHVSGQPMSPQAASPYGGYGYPGYGMPVSPPTNGLAIASLVCSLVGLATCITAPVGAVLGHVARRQIRERGEGGDSMALAGIIIGWILTGLFVVVIAVYIVVIVVAVSQAETSGTSSIYDDVFRIPAG